MDLHHATATVALRLSQDLDSVVVLVPLPVSDVDRAKAFYAEKVRFNVDLDVSADTDPRVSGDMRVVQLTPPAPSRLCT